MSTSNPEKKDGAQSEEMISLEDIDRILESEDKEFADSIKKIGEDQDLKNAQIVVEEEPDPLETKEEEKPKRGLRNFLRTLKENISLKLKEFRDQLKEKLKTGIKDLFIWLRTKFPEYVKWFFSQIKKVFASIGKVVSGFFAQVGRHKWSFLAALLSLAAAVGVSFLLIKNKSLFNFGPHAIHSLQEHGRFEGEIQEREDLIELYRAFPQPEFTVLLSPIKVNLREVRGSRHPMATIEFFVALDSQDTAIEVKDRQKEIVDLVSRETEGFSYDELNSTEGMNQLKVNVRKAINRILNQGRVQRLYVNTFVSIP